MYECRNSLTVVCASKDRCLEVKRTLVMDKHNNAKYQSQVMCYL